MRTQSIHLERHKYNDKADFVGCWSNRRERRPRSPNRTETDRADKHLRMKRARENAKQGSQLQTQLNIFLPFSLLSSALCLAGALQIENSEETDQGKYECVATNSQGVRYSSPANLYVRGRTWTQNTREHAHTCKDNHTEVTTIKVLLV